MMQQPLARDHYFFSCGCKFDPQEHRFTMVCGRHYTRLLHTLKQEEVPMARVPAVHVCYLYTLEYNEKLKADRDNYDATHRGESLKEMIQEWDDQVQKDLALGYTWFQAQARVTQELGYHPDQLRRIK